MNAIDSYKGILPGHVIAHYLKKNEFTQKQLAFEVGEYPQTINAILAGRRDIPVGLSLRLDRALGFEEGTLLILQTYYKIKLEQQKEMTRSNGVPIPRIRSVVFWDTDPSLLDWDKHRTFIMKRVLEKGSEEEINAVKQYYGEY